jgi:acetylornithine/N-succinyldiaminopimelate aminotransferase
MIGIELNKGSDKIIEMFLKKNILVNVTSGNILRLLPPLIISRKEIKYFLESFDAILKKN